MAGFVRESWLEWGLGAAGDAAPRPPEVEILATHDAVTKNSRKAQEKFGKLVNQGRHVAHTASLDELPDSTPTGNGRPAGGRESKMLAKAHCRSLQGEGATAGLRARPTASLRVIPETEFVGIRRCFMGVEERVAVRLPCCDATDVETRHTRICPRAGAQMTQHQPFLHAISRILKLIGVSHQVESGEPFTAGRNFRMDIVVRRGGLRNARSPEYRDKPILVDVTHADSHAQVHLRAGSAGHDKPAASTSETRNCQQNARLGHESSDEPSHKLTTFAVESFGCLGVEGSYFIDYLSASVMGGERRRVDGEERGVERTSLDGCDTSWASLKTDKAS